MNLGDKVPLQPGNSDGALVDERGNDIGIVSAKLPMFVYMNCSQLKDYFTMTGIGPASFSDFNDKDRVQKVLLDLDEAINKTYEQLDPPSCKEVDECRRFIEEESHLNEFIDWLKTLRENKIDPSRAQAELVRKEAMLKEKKILHAEVEYATKLTMEEVVTKFEKKLKLFLLPVFSLAGIGWIILEITEHDIESISDFLVIFFVLFLWFPFMLFILYSLTRIVVVFIYKQNINGSKIAEEKIKCLHPDIAWEDLKEHIATLEDRCNKLRISLSEVDKFYAKFGKLSEAEALALQIERQKRVAKVFSST